MTLNWIITIAFPIVGRFDVQESSYDRPGAGDDVLYLLRNRKPNRLEMYTLP
jgi:hypothetical protein